MARFVDVKNCLLSTC